MPRAFIKFLGFFPVHLWDVKRAFTYFSKNKEYNYFLHDLWCKQVIFALNFFEI